MNAEQEMATPTQFLEDFTRDIVAHPEFRTQLIAGYAKLLELREEGIRKETVISVFAS